MTGFLAGIIGLAFLMPAAHGAACKPALAFKEVQFSQMRPPTLERKWTALVSVDASRCAANAAGHFEILFARSKEIGLDAEFRERFEWRPPMVEVVTEFWGDEAVVHYAIDAVTPCPCRD